MVRILLVEDQAMIRRGLADLINLSGEFQVVEQAEDGERAEAMMRVSRADIALLDVQLPVRTGIEVIERLSERNERFPPTLLLTTFDDDEMLFRGIRAGARGFLLKAASFEDLAASIQAVANGETWFKPAVTDRVRRFLGSRPDQIPSPVLLEQLTRRETEILRLMAGGFSNREIADALEMSEGTVRNHGSTVFSKLGVRDRTRAVLKGIELGLV